MTETETQPLKEFDEALNELHEFLKEPVHPDFEYALKWIKLPGRVLTLWLEDKHAEQTNVQ
jgi:hypothetical protein